MEENERIVNDILSSGPSSIEDPHPVSGGEVVSNASPSVTLEEKHEETESHETVSSVESINREEVPSRTPEIHNEDPHSVTNVPEGHTTGNEESSIHVVDSETLSHTETNVNPSPVAETAHVEERHEEVSQPLSTPVNETSTPVTEVHEKPLEGNPPSTTTSVEVEPSVHNDETLNHPVESREPEDLGVTSADVHNITEDHHVVEDSPVSVTPSVSPEEHTSSVIQPPLSETHETPVTFDSNNGSASEDHHETSDHSNETSHEVSTPQPTSDVHTESAGATTVENHHDTETTVGSTPENHREETVSEVHTDSNHSVGSSMVLSEPPKVSADEELPKETSVTEVANTPNNSVDGTAVSDQGSVTVSRESNNENHTEEKPAEHLAENSHVEEQPPVVSQPTPEEHHEETTSVNIPQPESSPTPNIESVTANPTVENNTLPKTEVTPSEPHVTETGSPENHGLNSEESHAGENVNPSPAHVEERHEEVSQPLTEEHHEEAPITAQPEVAPTPSEPHITETGVPETPRLTSENVEGPIRPEIPSPEDKKKEDETDKLKNIEENKAPSNDSAIVSPSTSEENESKEKKSKTAFDLFNEVDDDKLMYIIDRRLYDNGYQLSAFVTYIRYNSNHILDPDKKLYVLKMDNCITSNRYRSLSNKEGWKEALSYTGLDLEKMLNSGDYVFVTEEDYNKKIKKITERNANLSKVDKKDINYSTYENINRRRL